MEQVGLQRSPKAHAYKHAHLHRSSHLGVLVSPAVWQDLVATDGRHNVAGKDVVHAGHTFESPHPQATVNRCPCQRRAVVVRVRPVFRQALQRRAGCQGEHGMKRAPREPNDTRASRGGRLRACACAAAGVERGPESPVPQRVGQNLHQRHIVPVDGVGTGGPSEDGERRKRQQLRTLPANLVCKTRHRDQPRKETRRLHVMRRSGVGGAAREAHIRPD